jgi:hypothetical protein
MTHAVAPETMGAYVLRKVPALPPMVKVSGPQASIDPRRRSGDAGGIARSRVELGQVVIQKHAPLLHSMIYARYQCISPRSSSSYGSINMRRLCPVIGTHRREVPIGRGGIDFPILYES